MDPRAWNRFSYVYGNPVNYTDPSGHNPLAFMLIGASLFGMGSAIHYSATHPGSSFDQDEYLSTVWRATKWGGFAGALLAIPYAEPAIFGAKFGIPGSSIFWASATTGVANIVITGVNQGRYNDLRQVEDAFLSGFYSTYSFVLTSGGAAAAFQIPRTAIKTRAFIAGIVGIGNGARRGEVSGTDVALNFVTNFAFGIFSPSISDTSKRVGFGLFGVRSSSFNNPHIYPTWRSLDEYIGLGLGHTFATLAITATKPGMQELYLRMARQGWQYITQ